MDKDCVSDVPSADTDVDSKAEESDLGECACTDEADEDAGADATEGRCSTDGEEEEVGSIPAVRVLVGIVCMWRGTYFYMTKRDTYTDMKVRMYVQWARDEEMVPPLCLGLEHQPITGRPLRVTPAPTRCCVRGPLNARVRVVGPTAVTGAVAFWQRKRTSS